MRLLAGLPHEDSAHVGVALSREYTHVSQNFLHNPEACSPFEEPRRRAVADFMRMHDILESRSARELPELPPEVRP